MACSTAAVVAAVSRSGLSIMKSWMRAVVADARGAHAGLGEPAGVGLALVAEHVVLVDDDEGLGQPGEVVERSPAAVRR